MTGLSVAALALILAFLLRDHPAERDSPSLQPRNISPPGNQHPEKGDGLIVVEDVDLSADELRELEELFGPVEDKRTTTEVVRLGQSVLCDVLVYDDGRVAYTFLTPQSMISDSGEIVLIFKSETSMLHPDGGLDTLTSPTVITRENQSARISIGREGGNSYSMQFSGILIGDDALALSAKMTGDPDIQ